MLPALIFLFTSEVNRYLDHWSLDLKSVSCARSSIICITGYCYRVLDQGSLILCAIVIVNLFLIESIYIVATGTGKLGHCKG